MTKAKRTERRLHARRVTKNTETLARIHLHQLALGDTIGTTQLLFRPGGRSILNFDMSQGTLVLEAQKVTIDSLNTDRLDLLYLDTERSELEILRGGKATIDRDLPVIVLEILDGQEEEYAAFMRGIGYRQVAITHRDAIFTHYGY